MRKLLQLNKWHAVVIFAPTQMSRIYLMLYLKFIRLVDVLVVYRAKIRTSQVVAIYIHVKLAQQFFGLFKKNSTIRQLHVGC